MRILWLCALVASACASSWNYSPTSSHGPSHWPDECVKRTSLSQSPIDIRTAVKRNYPDFNFYGYDHVDVELANNGHTVKATVKAYENARFTGGGLYGTYKLAQFHLHWGSSNSKGSEHKLNTRQYPMEVHFVHYNTKYGDINTAVDKSDGLAVLAWFFTIDDKNDDWEYIFRKLPLSEDGSKVNIYNLDLEDLMEDDDEFYRYQGSLTTPPCFESVTWTIFKEKIEISSSQMSKVRSVVNSHHHHIYNNFRPTQKLNTRIVYYQDD